jgi:uncharacterized protein YlxW (UPF0749 family)
VSGVVQEGERAMSAPTGSGPAPATPPPVPRRAPDASMDLLNQIIEHPVDPDYALVAARDPDPRRRSGRRSRVAFGLVGLLIGALFAVAAVQTTRSKPLIENERSELVSRIRAAQSTRDQLRERADRLAAENARLRNAGLGDTAGDRALRSRLAGLEAAVGAAPVVGPGLEITVDDGTGGNGANRVLDIDLQVLLNGLWAAGAEAVQINGQRVTSLTAVREAGQAITVNYRSLAPPYTVDAIGDPKTLHARLLETSAGPWWNSLQQNQGMRYDVSTKDRLRLAGVANLAVRVGRKR